MCLGGCTSVSLEALCSWAGTALSVSRTAWPRSSAGRAEQPDAAAACHDTNARCQQGLRQLVEDALRPLVAEQLCVVSGEGNGARVPRARPLKPEQPGAVEAVGG